MNAIEPNQIHVRPLPTADGQTIMATVYPTPNPKGTVILASALGVPQSYYARYAKYLMENGYQSISFDYRGTALSCYQGNLDQLQLIDWGKQDLHRVIQEARTLAADHSHTADNILLVGHSIGGQLTGMSDETQHIQRAIFVASSAPYWKRWQGMEKLSMFFSINIMIPLACFGRKIFPAKAVGFSSINMPASVATKWVKWMNTPDYLFDKEHGYDISGYKNLSMPILSLGFDDDHFAPKVNIDWLLKFFPNCQIDNTQIAAKQHGGIGHMGFFHDRHKNTLWQDSLNWLEKNHKA